MKLSSIGLPSVTLDEARSRLIAFRDSDHKHYYRHFYPSHLAGIIWPGHRMNGQGAGFAAAGLLNKLGISWSWNVATKSGGYCLSSLKEE